MAPLCISDAEYMLLRNNTTSDSPNIYESHSFCRYLFRNMSYLFKNIYSRCQEKTWRVIVIFSANQEGSKEVHDEATTPGRGEEVHHQTTVPCRGDGTRVLVLWYPAETIGRIRERHYVNVVLQHYGAFHHEEVEWNHQNQPPSDCERCGAKTARW